MNLRKELFACCLHGYDLHTSTGAFTTTRICPYQKKKIQVGAGWCAFDTACFFCAGCY
jgi:hypothetical protein